MRFPILVMLGIVLRLPQSLENQDQDLEIILDQNVVGVLGEDVYLHCLYTGDTTIIFSSWTRQDSMTSAKRLAGYRSCDFPYSRDGFSTPASCTNLTVKVNVSSLNMEGRYTCAFGSEEDDMKRSLFLTVWARPHVRTYTEENVQNGTHYQSVFCSASNAKPMARLHWEIRGAAPSEDVFSIHTTNFTEPNGTASIVSVLRFPIHLNNESSVACVIEHPALSSPSMTQVQLQTFVAPDISMEMVLIKKEGNDFLRVICQAKGGRPHPSITWLLSDWVDTSFSKSYDVGLESVSSTYWFSSNMYEGEVISCTFGYPHLPAMKTTSVTLPIYDLTSLQLSNSSVVMSSENVLILEEGVTDIIIGMEAIGNVPSYELNCTKDDEPLPEDVVLVNSHLLFKGPMGLGLAGQYHCQASYFRHTASLHFGIEVHPRVLLPATFPPNISVSIRKEADAIYIDCSASDASPAPNVFWDLSRHLNRTVQSNVTSSNSSHSVRSILKLPACLSQTLTVECVVEHVVLTDQERRQIVLHACAPIRVTLQSNTGWNDWVAYTEVQCRADNVTPDATVSWDTEDCRNGIGFSETGGQEEHGVVWSTARFSVPSIAGCTVSCLVNHQGWERPVKKSIQIPLREPSMSHVTIGPHNDSMFWAAVCQYEGDGVVPNISWVIGDPSITVLPSKVNSTIIGIKALVKSVIVFPLSRYEGKFLTCVIQNDYGEDEKKVVYVPKHFLSSIEVLNKTTLLSGGHGIPTAVHRISLQEHVPNQRIVFRIKGNASANNFKCFRSSGLVALTVDTTLVFAHPISKKDAGLYTCNASWYNQKTSVFVQVEVTSQEEQNLVFILICLSTSAAFALILIVMLCIFCKKSGESRPSPKDRKNRESLAALMQDPRSPELKKAGGRGQEYAELVHYSIVIDVKTTV